MISTLATYVQSIGIVTCMIAAATSFYHYMIYLVLHEKSLSRKILWTGQKFCVSNLSILYFCGRYSRNTRHGLQRYSNWRQGKSRNKNNSLLQSFNERACHLHSRSASSRYMQINSSRDDSHEAIEKRLLWKNTDQGCGRILRGRGKCRRWTNREELHSLQVELARYHLFEYFSFCVR